MASHIISVHVASGVTGTPLLSYFAVFLLLCNTLIVTSTFLTGTCLDTCDAWAVAAYGTCRCWFCKVWQGQSGGHVRIAACSLPAEGMYTEHAHAAGTI